MKGKSSLRRVGSLVLAAAILFGVAIMSSTAVQAQRRGGGFHGGFHGGGFHGEFRGGFHDRRFHGGFRPRIFIGPRFGYGYPYRYYGCPYGYYRYPYGPCYPW
jgi:hypothetical protein